MEISFKLFKTRLDMTSDNGSESRFGGNLRRFLPAPVLVNKAITMGSNSKVTHNISLSGECSCSCHRQTTPTTFALWLSSHRSVPEHLQ